ncbi:MAG: hypothetical protein ACKO96_39025, partial [Flammeovirgaceae bacterium]
MNEEAFLKFVIGNFFSQQAIFNTEKVVSSPSVYQLLRLVERTQVHGIFVSIVDLLLEKSTEVIQSIENGNILEEQLGETELTNFYNILGVIVCCH